MKNYTLDANPGVEERVASLFQPDTVLPAQYLQVFRRKTYLEPEKKLMLSVLEDAIGSFQKYLHARDGRRKMLFHEAEEWILDEDWGSVFSFENVCAILGLEPDYVRNGLLRWKKKKLAVLAKSELTSFSRNEKRRKRCAHKEAREIGRPASRAYDLVEAKQQCKEPLCRVSFRLEGNGPGLKSPANPRT